MMAVICHKLACLLRNSGFFDTSFASKCCFYLLIKSLIVFGILARNENAMGLYVKDLFVKKQAGISIHGLLRNVVYSPTLMSFIEMLIFTP